MEYQEIIDQYKNNNLNIQDLKNKLTISKPLQGRAKYRALTVVDERSNLKLNVVNALVLPETEDKAEEFLSGCNAELNSYFAILIDSIRQTKAWKFIDKIPSKYTINKFNVLKIKEKFDIIDELNRLYLGFLEYQKVADIRDCLRNNPNSDITLKKVEFINLMFSNLKSNNSRTEFFLLNKKFLMALVDSQKKRNVKFEDFMMSKSKSISSDFEYFSKYFSSEDFIDIAENIMLTSKTLKTSLNNIIEIFGEISETELEMNYLNEEYDYFEQLKVKLKKYEEAGIVKDILGQAVQETKQIELEKNNEESIATKDTINIGSTNPKKENVLKEVNSNKKVNNLKEQKVEKTKKEIELQNQNLNKTEIKNEKKTNKINKINENSKATKVEETEDINNDKEKIIPIIISWFEIGDITLTRTLSIQKITDFIESLKLLEEKSGKKCKIMLITNSSKEITIKRVLELEKRCRARGLANVVEGAFGGYCSFFVDVNGNCKNVAIMPENNRYKVIKVLEQMEYFMNSNILEANKDFIRYQMITRKDDTNILEDLKKVTDRIMSDSRFSRHPLLVLPYIEGKEAGTDIIMKSQVEGWLKIPEFFEFKYNIAKESIRVVRINEKQRIENIIISYYESFVKLHYKNDPEKVKTILEIIERKLSLFIDSSVDKIIEDAKKD